MSGYLALEFKKKYPTVNSLPRISAFKVPKADIKNFPIGHRALAMRR
jgi:hypothetical protein